MTAPVAKAADALLAARTAPWVDLLSPKAPAGAGQTPAVLNASPVDNDVLLPHGNALRPQPAPAGEPPRAALPATLVRGASSTDLSTAARVIQGLLSEMREGEAGPVRGQSPVWPATRQVPAAPALAAALSQQVADSGLFYESHLAQFAAGTRNLAQMQREPQAALARQPVDGRGTQQAQDGATQQQQLQRALPAQLLPVAAAQAQAAAVPPAPAAPVVAPAPTPMQHAPAGSAGGEAAQSAPRHDAAAAAQPLARAAGAQAMPHAANVASVIAQQADAVPVAERASATPNLPDSPTGAVVHPQAAPLVHQQLDLLASAMFRWRGEAWPGVPMEWTVQEEGGRAPRETDEPPAQPQWSTALSLELPRLGRVDLRMKLDGTSVRAQLAAPQRDALTQLRVHRSGLSQRLAAAGFELRALQLDTELAA